MACVWKQYWSYWRNTNYNAVRLLLSGVFGLVIVTIFWNLSSKREGKQDLFDATGCMYVAVIFLGTRNSSSVQPVVAIERTVFYRERAACILLWHTPLGRIQVIIEIPYSFAQTIIYVLIVYAMIGFELTAYKLFWFMYFTFFSLLYFTYFGMMSVAISSNLSMATITSSLFYSIWNLFSGFVVPKSRIPIWWSWYYWACPVAWSLYGLLVSQFGDVEDKLENGQTVKGFLRSYFGFRHELLGVVAVAIIGFPTLFSLKFAYAIKMLNFQRR